MSEFYSHYATRPRNGLGVRVKRRIAEKIIRDAALPPSARVFELGPGDGDIADLMHEGGHSYSAMDASPGVVAELRRRGHEVVEGFAPHIPASARALDAVFCMHVIEHMSQSDVHDFLVTLRERLNPQARVVIATPDFARWGHHFYDSDYTHCWPFTGRKLKQTLEAAGFTVVVERLQVGPLFGLKWAWIGWLAKTCFTPTVQDFLRRHLRNDIASRAFLTILPNLVFTAKALPGRPGSA